MRLLMPVVRNLKIVYSYLLLKGLEKGGIVSYSDVQDAIAVAGVSPTKPQVKKYLLMLKNHQPPLIEFHRAGLYEQYYRIKPYVVYEEEDKPVEAGMGEVFVLRNDLMLVLSDENADNTITLSELLMKLVGRQNEPREVSEP
jgi:hypothetical protein